MKKKKLNKLKVCCLFTSLLAIYMIVKFNDITTNIICLLILFINHLYIMTPITRVEKRKK